jgi:hypothetical protein
MSEIKPENFGAKADGKTNDYDAILAAYNATPIGGTLQFTGGKTYLTNKALRINKPITLAGNSAELKIDATVGGENYNVVVASTFGPAVSFTQAKILNGTNVFTVQAAKVSVGDYVRLDLGQDPVDPAETHWTAIVRVIAKTNTNITIDTPVDFDINVTGPHKLFPVTSFAQNVQIKNLKMTYKSGTTPDAAVVIQYAYNVDVSNIIIDSAIGFIFADGVKNGSLKNADISTHKLHPSAGTGFSCYGCNGITADNLVINTDSDSMAAIGFENFGRNINIGWVTWNSSLPIDSNTLSAIGIGYNGVYRTGVGICIEHLVCNCAAKAMVFGDNGGARPYTLLVKNLYCNKAHQIFTPECLENLAWYDGHPFGKLITSHKTLVLPQNNTWTPWGDLTTHRGIARRVWVRSTHAPNTTNQEWTLFWTGNTLQGAAIDAKTVPSINTWYRVWSLEIPGGYDNTYNNCEYSISGAGNPNIPKNQVVEFVVEYWPKNNENGGLIDMDDTPRKIAKSGMGNNWT